MPPLRRPSGQLQDAAARRCKWRKPGSSLTIAAIFLSAISWAVELAAPPPCRPGLGRAQRRPPRVARLGAVASPAAHRLSAVNYRILGRKQFTRPETALMVLVRSVRRLEAVAYARNASASTSRAL